jgi:hypothetical protein
LPRQRPDLWVADVVSVVSQYDHTKQRIKPVKYSRPTTSIGPARNITCLFDWHANRRQSASIENGHPIAGAAHFISISWTRRVTVALVCSEYPACGDHRITEALNAVFYAGNRVAQPNARIDAGFDCELVIIWLLVTHNSSIRIVDPAAVVFPACRECCAVVASDSGRGAGRCGRGRRTASACSTCRRCGSACVVI